MWEQPPKNKLFWNDLSGIIKLLTKLNLIIAFKLLIDKMQRANVWIYLDIQIDDTNSETIFFFFKLGLILTNCCW